MPNELPPDSSGDKSLDVFGVKPIGKAIEKTTDACVDGASAFLSRVCLPAAEEFGLLLRDKVRHWRSQNAARIAEQASTLIEPGNKGQVHPRLAWEILEKGSWASDDTIQKMWAGILASCVGEDANDDGNIQFIALLAAMTKFQVLFINYACEKAPKIVAPSGLPWANMFMMETTLITEITGVSDLQRIDREIDHLRHLSLVDENSSGFTPTNSKSARVRVTPLALHLYVKSKGVVLSPIEYWNLKPGTPDLGILDE